MVNYNFDALTIDSKRILANGYGWRNDNIYGSGINDAFKIIDYEVFEIRLPQSHWL